MSNREAWAARDRDLGDCWRCGVARRAPCVSRSGRPRPPHKGRRPVDPSIDRVNLYHWLHDRAGLADMNGDNALADVPVRLLNALATRLLASGLNVMTLDPEWFA